MGGKPLAGDAVNGVVAGTVACGREQERGRIMNGWKQEQGRSGVFWSNGVLSLPDCNVMMTIKSFEL
eukprot:5350715-Pleurochrysis_carterae.AAC.1